nr:IS256 family transposase [Lujinxingiaceae bacterium]
MPRDRNASFAAQVLGKGASVSEELERQVISMYAGGMTTRDISAHVRELYNTEVSDMFVSRLVERLDPELAAWRNRALEPLYPVVFVDCLHQKIRQANGVVSTAIYQVCAYDEQGNLEVLGVWTAPATQSPKESASFWHQVLIELEGRGVKDILILCGDGLSGLEQTVNAVYPHTLFLTCVVHLVRNSLRLVNWKERKPIAKSLRAIYGASTFEQAEYALLAFEEQWGSRHPGLVKQWKVNLVKISALWGLPATLRKLVYTTNAIENLNRQVRKVTKSRGVFPNTDSALRLITLFHTRREEKLKHTKMRKD